MTTRPRPTSPPMTGALIRPTNSLLTILTMGESKIPDAMWRRVSADFERYRRGPRTGARRADSRGYHETNADDTCWAGHLMQHHQTDDHRERGLEAHQGAERGRGQPAQREEFERERHDRQQNRQANADQQDVGSDPRQHPRADDDGGNKTGDGHRHGQRVDSGDLVSGPLREK